KEHSSGRFFRLTTSAKWDHLFERLSGCLWYAYVNIAAFNFDTATFLFCISEPCLDEAISDRVDINVEPAPLPSQCFRHPNYPHLRSGVVDLTGIACDS